MWEVDTEEDRCLASKEVVCRRAFGGGSRAHGEFERRWRARGRVVPRTDGKAGEGRAGVTDKEKPNGKAALHALRSNVMEM